MVENSTVGLGAVSRTFTTRGRAWLVGTAAVAMIFVAGCGTAGNDASGAPTTTDDVPVLTTTPTPTTTPPPPPTTTTTTTTTTVAPPPPPPVTQQPAPPPVTQQPPPQQCDPNYSGCVPIASDVDCAGGSGNGPAYVDGPVDVIGTDIYGLDRDHDGIACE